MIGAMPGFCPNPESLGLVRQTQWTYLTPGACIEASFNGLRDNRYYALRIDPAQFGASSFILQFPSGGSAFSSRLTPGSPTIAISECIGSFEVANDCRALTVDKDRPVLQFQFGGTLPGQCNLDPTKTYYLNMMFTSQFELVVANCTDAELAEAEAATGQIKFGCGFPIQVHGQF